MRCPYCQFRDSRVTDSRGSDSGIRRRRECTACGERFTTFESAQLSAVQIVKKDGRREEFNREKLLAGLRKACEKREIGVQALEGIAADIEARVTGDGGAEVASQLVGELAMDALRKLDHIAYIRFASVYRAFTDIESLKEAVQALEEGRVASVDSRSLQLPLLDEPEEEPAPARPRLRAVGGRAAAGAKG